MYYDSCEEKSTIVEFADHVVLLEVASVYDGGESPRTEHLSDGLSVISAIESYFPKKPLRYVLHSHYHSHSLSSAKPFLDRGIKIVSTQKNYDKLQDFIDTKQPNTQANMVIMQGDSMVFADASNRIVAYRLTQDKYPNLPTADYLFFHLPQYEFLYVGCMYTKYPSRFKEHLLISGRCSDIVNFYNSKQFPLKALIRLSADSLDRGLNPVSEFNLFRSEGITIDQLVDPIFKYDVAGLRQNQHKICEEYLKIELHPSNINGLVYHAISQKQLDRALELAVIQCLLSPENSNAWDTQGEVYYKLGNDFMAKNCAETAKAIDPTYSGGMQNWSR